jgi:hypothetical protein
VAPPGTPKVVGWGNYSDALDGKPLFVNAFNSVTGRIADRSGHGVSIMAQKALAEGAQYTWDKELLSQNVSILWRTTEYDGDVLAGFSGSALCLGSLSDQTCLAICFQNFDSPLNSREALKHDHHPVPKKNCSHPRVHGGFLLPKQIREAEILCEASECVSESSTYPSRERATTELRRSFSSHRH